ncbi:MAG: GTP-binding protein [Rhodospirillales bacterium]|nr:GTP-binding protein [Rhodospirillales bacterium]
MSEIGAETPEAPGLDPEALAIPDEPLPVSVLTGFLGSGKTTVLRHLLGHPAMEETAVVINEFGEVGLDHLLVEKADEDTVLLNSGCLCCTVRGDLIETLRDLFKRRVKREVPAFARLVIETTGLADPAPILHTLMNDPLLVTRFRLDGVIATVDAVTGGATLDRHEEALKQAAVADRLLITKTDLAEAAVIDGLDARLGALNPAGRRYRITQGEIAPDKLFGAGLYDPETKSLDVRRWLKAEAYAARNAQGHGDHQGHDVNRHDARIRAFCLSHDAPLDWDRFNDWVEMLITVHGARILRVKGLINVAQMDRPVVIHGVQHIFHPPVLLDAWPGEDRRSQLVFIVRDLEPEMFEHTLEAFTGGGA